MKSPILRAVALSTAGAGVLAVALGSSTAGASEPVNLAPFTAAASASSAHMTISDPDVNLVTPTPVDGAGPAAQALLTATGDSSGYAGFPDPGQFIVSAPGLGTGLLQQGAGGLPPLPVTIPAYPFAVSTSFPTQPEASVGDGPYQLRSTSDEVGSDAEAIAGLQLDAVGKTAFLHSAAKTVSESDGRVESTSQGGLDGLSLGPLAIGSVRTLAQVVRSADGTLRPTGTIEIAGLKVGGAAATVDAKQLSFAGTTTPLELAPVLNEILKSSGISLAIAPGTTTKLANGYEVTSPALVITSRFDSKQPGFGVFTVTTTIGRATAKLTQAGTGGAIPAGTVGPAGAVSGPGIVPGAVDGIAAAPGLGQLPSTAAGPATVDFVPGSAVQALAALQTPDNIFDIRSFYLVLVAAGCAVGGLAVALRRYGG
jgi:hypothetical protein